MDKNKNAIMSLHEIAESDMSETEEAEQEK